MSAQALRGSRMARLSGRLYAGMAERGITGAVAEEIVGKLAAFANFGFPESHAVSFAYLVYSSAWLKLHYPAAFCAGLLDAQPMGNFWVPSQSLVADARRHGVTVRKPHVDESGARTTLDWDVAGPASGPVGAPTRQPAVRLGLMAVRGVGEAVAERIAAGRPYASVEDLVRRGAPNRAQLEALATAGALVGLPAATARRRSTTGGARCGRLARWRWGAPSGCPGSCRARRRRHCRR